MSSPRKVGDKVMVRGTTFTITRITHQGHLGSSFFGKFRFYLRAADGREFYVYGKGISWNSRLMDIPAYERQETK